MYLHYRRSNRGTSRRVKIYLISLCLGVAVPSILLAADQSADGVPYDHSADINLSENDQNAGEKLYTGKGCIDCHGPRGYSADPDMFPRIAGLDKQYIVEQLLAFRSGGRQNVIMSPVAATLTVDDITALAAFIAAKH